MQKKQNKTKLLPTIQREIVICKEKAYILFTMLRKKIGEVGDKNKLEKWRQLFF